MTSRVTAELLADLETEEAKAWGSLARYKFMQFGYHAAIWVHLNRVGHFRRPNPWHDLVMLARLRGPTAEPSSTALFDEAA